MAAAAHLTLVAPDNEKFTVRSAPAGLPRRKPNAEYRSREHLTEREVGRLIEAMKGNRWGHRDATMVLIAFRHGLRASELVDLLWDQVDLENALLRVRRLKNGTPATHPLTGKELRVHSSAQSQPLANRYRSLSDHHHRLSSQTPRGPPNHRPGGADHDPVSGLYPVPGLLPPPSPQPCPPKMRHLSCAGQALRLLVPRCFAQHQLIEPPCLAFVVSGNLSGCPS